MRNTLFASLCCISVMAFAQKLPDIQFTKYKYDNKCFTFLYKTGSQITIPENAFMYEAGMSCDGPVEIQYRELHTVTDFVAANINLDNVEGNKKMHLESGGMFEIEAICLKSGAKLKLAKNKKIDVLFASKNAITKLTTWFYEKTSKIWRKYPTPLVDIAINASNKDNDKWGSSTVPSINQGNGNNMNNIEMDGDGYMDPKEMARWRYLDSLRKETFKTLKVDKMGMYNCDRIFEEAGAIPLIADFKTSDPQNTFSTVYVAYRSINSLVTYYKGEVSVNLLPQKDIVIFALSDNGKLLKYPDEKLQKLDFASLKDKKITFELEEIAPITDQQAMSLKLGLL